MQRVFCFSATPGRKESRQILYICTFAALSRKEKINSLEEALDSSGQDYNKASRNIYKRNLCLVHKELDLRRLPHCISCLLFYIFLFLSTELRLFFSTFCSICLFTTSEFHLHFDWRTAQSCIIASDVI